MIDTILYATFKYALGRTTYCVFDVACILKKYRGHLSQGSVSQIVSDINTAEKEHRLGHECDAKDWRGVRAFLMMPFVETPLVQEFTHEELESLYIYATRHFLRENEVNTDFVAFAKAYKDHISAHLKVLILREISDHVILRANGEWKSLLIELQGDGGDVGSRGGEV